jgi:hypothetical protein
VQVWGKLVGSEAGYDGTRHNTVVTSYIDILVARGLVRSDLAAPELTYAFQSVFEGFIYAERTAVQRERVTSGHACFRPRSNRRSPGRVLPTLPSPMRSPRCYPA